MKKIQLIGLAFGILAVAFHQSFTLADEYEDDNVQVYQVSTLRSLKELTPEEEALANEARAHIARAIENNLVRLLAIANARGDRRPRQDDEDEEVTPNPNVLPQVAQILGAIFSGSLNISRVVDRTFGLVPNIVRNQVGGIVKLLTGENMDGSTTVAASGASAPATAAVTPAPAPTAAPQASSTAPAVKENNEAVIVEVPNTEPTTTNAPATAQPQAETIQEFLSQGDGGSKGKYRIRNRTKGTTTTTRRPLEDDEIEKLADDLRRAARAYEPTMRDKDPRGIADAFKTVISRINFNTTEITRAVPSIFKGTRQAFVVLDNLGILDVNDVLDELDLPALEEEEEEEEEEQ